MLSAISKRLHPKCFTSTPWGGSAGKKSLVGFVTVCKEVPNVSRICHLQNSGTSTIRLQLARAALLGGCQTWSCTANPSALEEQKKSGATGKETLTSWASNDKQPFEALLIEVVIVVPELLGWASQWKARSPLNSVLSVMKAIKTKPEWSSRSPCKSHMDSLMREGHYLFSHPSSTHVRNVPHIGN